jgi:hypothetical protein
MGIPARFLDHGKVADIRADLGLSVQNMSRQIVEWAALVLPGGAGHRADRPGSTPSTSAKPSPLSSLSAEGPSIHNGVNVARNGESVMGTGERGQERT